MVNCQMNITKKIYKFYYLKIKHDPISYARYLGVTIGSDCRILDDPDTIFGSEPWLVSVGRHVEITHGVRMIGHEGGLWVARKLVKFQYSDYFAPIVIGDNVFVGLYSIILPGVKVGNNVIIGAGSVVTKNIPDNMIAVGIPAKPVSSMEAFLEKMQNREIVDTKNMSLYEKRVFLQRLHPEWFDYERT